MPQLNSRRRPSASGLCQALAVLCTAFLFSAAGAPANAQYYEPDPAPESAPGNDILPPVDDTLLDAPLDDVAAPLPPPEPLEPIPPSRLKIASWDVSEAANLMPPPPTAQATAWRTSFGSERRAEAASKPAPASDGLVPDADIILLQGITDVAALRRLLPPRQWRLAVSRRALTTASTAAPAGEAAHRIRVTAVAIRARRGLRITGREPAIELAIAQHAPASATAVRIADGTRMLWLLSVALNDACSSEDQCAARGRLEEWQQGKRGGGEVTIVGGHFAARQIMPGQITTGQITSGQGAKTEKSVAPASADPCRYQTIDGAHLNGAMQQPVIGTKKDNAGCLALAELPPS